MKKAVIFDMDGLMIDSERTTYNCYVRKMNSLGLEFDEVFYKTLLGNNKKGVFVKFKEKYGKDIDMDDIWDDCHNWLNEALRKEVPLKKGIIELLEYLKNNNYKTIVATSSDRNRVDEILNNAGLINYFDDTICGNEVSKGKPDPEIFVTACKKLGVTNDEAIVLEDSESGILASYRGNIDVICIPDMKYPEEQYAEMTTEIFDDLTYVINWLEMKRKAE